MSHNPMLLLAVRDNHLVARWFGQTLPAGASSVGIIFEDGTVQAATFANEEPHPLMAPLLETSGLGRKLALNLWESLPSMEQTAISDGALETLAASHGLGSNNDSGSQGLLVNLALLTADKGLAKFLNDTTCPEDTASTLTSAIDTGTFGSLNLGRAARLLAQYAGALSFDQAVSVQGQMGPTLRSLCLTQRLFTSLWSGDKLAALNVMTVAVSTAYTGSAVSDEAARKMYNTYQVALSA